MFEKVTVVGGPLVLSPPAEVNAPEAQLGIRFPSGYREYVTQFGEGVLGGSYVRIYPPRRILSGANNLNGGGGLTNIGSGTASAMCSPRSRRWRPSSSDAPCG